MKSKKTCKKLYSRIKNFQLLKFREMDFYRFAEVLSEQRAATKENVERKQARTEFEREDSDDDESEEGERVKKFSTQS